MRNTFKDRLKANRREKGISQQQLADAIFVSRSAVAKWENGLGLPSKASYEALLEYFGVNAEEFSLNEELEIEAVKCNQKKHVIRSILFLVLLSIIAVAPIWLFREIQNGYGFTSEMAAGEIWCDDKCIKTDDYHIYYNTYTNDDEKYAMIHRFCIIEKKLVGYQRCDPSDYKRGVYNDNGEKYGNLYTLKDSEGYHHIFCSDIYMDQSGTYLYIVLDDVELDGKTIHPYRSSYFVTKNDLTEFNSGNEHFTVK